MNNDLLSIIDLSQKLGPALVRLLRHIRIRYGWSVGGAEVHLDASAGGEFTVASHRLALVVAAGGDVLGSKSAD